MYSSVSILSSLRIRYQLEKNGEVDDTQSDLELILLFGWHDSKKKLENVSLQRAEEKEGEQSSRR